MKVGVAVSDDLRKRVAVAKLKRLLEALDTAMKDLDEMYLPPHVPFDFSPSANCLGLIFLAIELVRG
jgi:hypothetical protein